MNYLINPYIFGGAAALPIPTTALVHHYRSDLGVTESSGVSLWEDQIGARDLSEATNKPSLQSSQIDGHDSIRFDGTNDRLQDSSGNLSQPVHFFAVMNQIAWSSGAHIIGETTDVNNPALEQDTVTPNIRINNAGNQSSAATIGSWRLISAYFNGTSSYVGVDGTEVAAGGGLTNAFSGGISLGCRGATAFANVEFAEVAVYSSERTSTDLSDIEDYFADRYPSLTIA